MVNWYHRILSITDLNQETKHFITRAVTIIFVYIFVVMLTNTFLILHALDFLSLSQLGVVLAIQFAVQALTDYPTGAIGDWIGQRWVLFIAALAYGVGFVLLSQSSNFIGILIAFILFALAQAQESGAFISWFDNNYKLIAVEDEDRRIYSQFFGSFSMLHQIITAVSFILGGLFIVFINRQFIFILQSILLIFISIFLLFFLRDYKAIKRQKSSFKSYFQYLRGGLISVSQNRTLRLMILGSVFSGVGFVIWSGLILFPLYASYGKSDARIAILRSIIFIFSAICTGIAGNISKHIYHLRKWLSLTILSGDVFFFFVMFVMLSVNPAPTTFSITSFIIVILVFIIAFGPLYIVEVLKPRFFLDVIPDQNRNAIYSLIPTFTLLASAFALPLGGILLDTIGRKSTILILAVNGLFGSLITAYAIYTYQIIYKIEEEAIELCCPIFPSKMTDTQLIVPLTIPCCWSFDPVTQYIWSQLKATILRDNIITEEENLLIENILFNVKTYGKVLEKALNDGEISHDEQQKLLRGREKIWVEAHNIAVGSDGLSEDAQNILTTLTKLLTILDTKKIFKV
ncbi:MAG: MFS transporter [Promethearchaeota archaeon]